MREQLLMIGFGVLVLFVGAISEGTAADDEAIVFKWNPLPVGQSEKTELNYTFEERRTLEVAGEEGKDKKDQKQKDHRFTGEAEAVWTRTPQKGPDGNRKMKIEYGKCSSRAALDDGEDVKRKKQAPAVSYKSYLVSKNKDGELDVSSVSGDRVSSYERDALEKQWKNLDERTMFCEILDGKSFSVGDTVKLPYKGLEELMLIVGEPDVPKEFRKMDLKLKEVFEKKDRKIARFSVLGSKGNSRKNRSRSFEGTIDVLVGSCRIYDLEIKMKSRKQRTRAVKGRKMRYSVENRLDLTIERELSK